MRTARKRPIPPWPPKKAGFAPFYRRRERPIFRRFPQEALMLQYFRSAVTIAIFAAVLLASPWRASAQDRRVPASAAELRLSYAPVVQRVAPAVVNVYAAKTVQNRNPLFEDPIFRRFFGVPGGGGSQVQRWLGSGVVVDSSGLIVTNNHVIEGADEVKISLADRREF